MTDAPGGDAELARLGDGLLEAQRLLAAVPETQREDLHRRVLAVTNSAKHDAPTALRRLDELLARLRAAAGTPGTDPA